MAETTKHTVARLAHDDVFIDKALYDYGCQAWGLFERGVPIDDHLIRVTHSMEL